MHMGCTLMFLAQRLKRGFFFFFSKCLDPRVFRDVDYAGSVLQNLLCSNFVVKSPSTTIVYQNASTLLCCEALEMFCGL